MKTVKEVSDLTGISVRTLHYYDEIGLLKPSEITKAGYRLYDEESLKVLQQVLFFKELDIPLKDIKEIMNSPHFDKMQSLVNQKKLLTLKRDRLNNLIDLIDKTLRGENSMSFKEFDMSEYFDVLDRFKEENKDKVIEMWGSVEKFDEFIEKAKSKEAKIAKSAIKEFGSIDKFTKAIEKNLNNADKMMKLSRQYDNFRKEFIEDINGETSQLFKELVSDISKDPSSKEIMKMAEEITNKIQCDYEFFATDEGEDHWYYMVKTFLVNTQWIKEVDNKYGIGSSKFIGECLLKYLGDKKPKVERLYDELTQDLSKDPCSKEIQDIVAEIYNEQKRNAKRFNMEVAENYFATMADLYLNNDSVKKNINKEYGHGAAEFIGKAFLFYQSKK